MNELRVYTDFQQCYADLIQHIKSAKRRVWLETYSLDRSKPAKHLMDTLIQASATGVQCVVCVDAFGSFASLPKLQLKIFRAAGGRLCVWNPLIKPHSFFNRNHRKLLVCDDTLYCLTGNMDWRCLRLPEDNFTRPVDVNHGMCIQGPAAFDGIESVRRTIKKCRLPFARELKEVPGWSSAPPPLQPGIGLFKNVRVTWLESEGLSSWYNNTYKNALKKTLEAARNSVFVASSYFQPPKFLRKRLIACLSRNVNVDILISGRSDVIGDESATSYTLRNHLFKKGLPRVSKTIDRHLHTKVLIVDEAQVIVGSYNWDRFSARRNREAGVHIDCADIAGYLLTNLRNIPSQAVAPSSQISIQQRVSQWLSYQALRFTAYANRKSAKAEG